MDFFKAVLVTRSVKTVMCLMLISITVSAEAQPINIDIDGRPCSCVPTGGGSQPSGDASQCATTAYAGPFSREESIRLCAGSRSDDPAKCAIAAYNGPFSREEAISICTRAYTTGPAECAIKAYAGPFSRTESVTLCSFPHADLTTAQCAINAYSGPYSREEAINLCRHKNKSLNGETKLLSKNEANLLLIEAKEKAFREGNYKH